MGPFQAFLGLPVTLKGWGVSRNETLRYLTRHNPSKVVVHEGCLENNAATVRVTRTATWLDTPDSPRAHSFLCRRLVG